MGGKQQQLGGNHARATGTVKNMLFMSTSLVSHLRSTISLRTLTHIQKMLPRPPTRITLALLKPDLSANSLKVSKVFEHIQKNEFNILAHKQLLWTKADAEAFYGEHRGKFFFERLCGYMTRYGIPLALKKTSREQIFILSTHLKSSFSIFLHTVDTFMH